MESDVFIVLSFLVEVPFFSPHNHLKSNAQRMFCSVLFANCVLLKIGHISEILTGRYQEDFEHVSSDDDTVGVS